MINRLYRLIWGLMALSLVIWPAISMPKPVNPLFQGTVPVKGRSTVARREALPKTLGQVLVKVSGNTEIATLAKIADAMQHAGEYVQRYRYLPCQGLQIASSTKSTLCLQATYDKQDIYQLLQTANQAIWGEARPLTLFLVTVTSDDQAATVFLNQESQTELVQFIQQFTQERGLPMAMPLLDLEEMKLVDELKSPLQLSPDNIHGLQLRYAADDVLLGSIVKSNHHWDGHWRLLLKNGQQFSWHNQAKHAGKLVQEMVNTVTDQLVDQDAQLVSTSLHNKVKLKILGVDGLHGYADVLKTLKSNPAIVSVDVKDFNTESIVVEVDVVGDESTLVHILTKDHHFELINDDRQLEATSTEGGLVCRWHQSALSISAVQEAGQPGE